jgi:Response regulators consisting of a CheY-like receiver domain and a winged-helix DNA-binding domain
MAKIMLVEDDKSLREIYSIRLVAEGYNIVSAGDGEEALGLAVQEKPDLIISDVMMPKISGFDMLDILRSTPETKDIKVIMMTALSSDEQRQRSEALGAAKHLVKSQCGIEDVINAVHEVLGDAPNTAAQANIATLNATATTAGKAAAEITPLNQPIPDMTNIKTEATTVVAPQDSSIPAPDSTRAMTSDQEMQPSVASAPSEAPAPAMEPTPISAAPVAPSTPAQPVTPEAPAQPVAPEAPAAPVAPATPAQPATPSAPTAPAQPAPVAPEAPAAPTAPVQNPAGENPVNFNQASVAKPVAVSATQSAPVQPVAGANIPVQGAALTPQQVLTMMGNGMGSMPQARPVVVIPQAPAASGTPAAPVASTSQTIPQVPKAGGTLPMPGAVPRAVAPQAVTPQGVVPQTAIPAMTPQQLALLRAQQQAQMQAQMQAAQTTQMPQATQAPRPAQPRTTGGERVLQPIHDPTQDQMRAAMAKRFADLLGEEDPAKPGTVTTKSASDATTKHDDTINVPTAAQINELIPPVPQNAQVAPAQPSVPTQPAEQPAMPTQTTAPIQTAQELAAQGQAQMQAKIQIDPNAKISDMASIPAPDEGIIEPIRPAFVNELEEQLAKDLSENSDQDSMSARMMKELADDETTKTALELASKMPKPEDDEIDESQVEMPESVAKAEFSSPNISSPNVSN